MGKRTVHFAVRAFFEDVECGRREILFRERFADPGFLGMEERIRHAAPDDELLVDLANKIAEQVELGRYLGAAGRWRTPLLRVAERLVQSLQLGLHQTPCCRRQTVRQSFGRGVGAMSC